MGRPIPTALDGALDPSTVEPVLVERARARFGPSTAVRGIEAELVKRRVVCYTIDLVRPGGGASERWRVIGKAYESRERAGQVFRAQRALWERGFPGAEPTSASIPEAYALLPDAPIVLMEPAGGESLKRLWRTGRARPEHARLFAEALAKLHGFPADSEPPFALEDHLAQRCAGLCPALAAVFPALADSIETIVETARRQPPCAPALAHGDYHPGQVHVDGEKLWILDLDPLHRGDPAYDVAMAVLTLRLLERGRARAGALRSILAAFLDAYFVRMDLEIASRLPVNLALILLKRACKRFRWQDERGWEDTVRLQVRRGLDCARIQGERTRLRGLDDVLSLCERCPVA
ncbi:MAG TPA: aminoglycoside phosphotransferase family protein [Planctomycetota bacterium]|jgi:aminoglycoside phosphotransferase (APT) family kinase protein|nr:aminoglycoside phosphotransferase family protein [Planctomycetota bacterium]